MAAGILPEPGTEYGPCADACVHTDCAATRAIADAPCLYCDQPIGYGARFYHVDTLPASKRKLYGHAPCHEAPPMRDPIWPVRVAGVR